MNEHNPLLTKWLRNLMYVHIAGLIVTAVSSITDLDSITIWFSRAISIGMICCLYSLQPVNPRYQKAAIFRTVMLICSWVAALLNASTILTFAASICSIIANYQEYSAHSDVVAEQDPKLSRKWHSLFNWSIVVGLATGFGSTLAVVIAVMAEGDTVVLTTIVLAAVLAVEALLEIVYLMYINRMLRLIEN